MGADLYLTKKKNPCGGFEVSKKAVNSGYFRDAYNDYGLFFRLSKNTNLDFSWWKTADRKELFNRRGNMTVEGAKTLLSEIRVAKNLLPEKLYNFIWDTSSTFENIIYNKCPMTEEDKKDFLEHLDLLIEFLELAIKEKSTIEWSV